MKKLYPIILIIGIILLTGCAKSPNTNNSTYQPEPVSNNGSQDIVSPSSDYIPIKQKTDRNCLIKGNISSSGEKIYHVPGGQYYEQTIIDSSKGERWFCSEQEAINAGWRKSKR